MIALNGLLKPLRILVKLLLWLLVFLALSLLGASYYLRRPDVQSKLFVWIAKEAGAKLTSQPSVNVALRPFGFKLNNVALEKEIRDPQATKQHLMLKVQAKELAAEANLKELFVSNRLEVNRFSLRHFKLTAKPLAQKTVAKAAQISQAEPAREKNTTPATNAHAGSSGLELSAFKIKQFELIDGDVVWHANQQPEFKIKLTQFNIQQLSLEQAADKSFLERLNLVATLAADSIAYDVWQAKDCQIKLQIAGGNVVLDPFSWHWPQGGSSKINLTLGQVNDLLQLDCKMRVKQLALANFKALGVPEEVGGVVTLNGTASANFKDWAELSSLSDAQWKRRLRSSGTLTVDDVIYQGLDLPYQIKRTRDLITKGESAEVDQKATKVDKAELSWDGQQGLFQLKPITAEASDCVLSGSGSIDLLKEKANIELILQLKKDETVKLPLRIDGPLSNVNVALDTEKFIKQQLQNFLQSSVADELQKKLGLSGAPQDLVTKDGILKLLKQIDAKVANAVSSEAASGSASDAAANNPAASSSPDAKETKAPSSETLDEKALKSAAQNLQKQAISEAKKAGLTGVSKLLESIH